MGRETREEFMFGTEPIEAWRMWDVSTIASSLGDDMERFIRAMSVATRKAPENPWDYMLTPRFSAIARADSSWEAREALPAVCTNGDDHQAPHLDCECGFWALKTPEAAARHYLDSYSGSAGAIGRVNLWGRFCEFDKGYRAEYAYPAEVWLIGKRANAAMAATLSDAYGIPVVAGEPEFLRTERAKREAERKANPDAGWQISTNIFRSFISAPMLIASSAAKIYWNEDTLYPANWPEGIARPSELMDELKKHDLWRSISG